MFNVHVLSLVHCIDMFELCASTVSTFIKVEPKSWIKLKPFEQVHNENFHEWGRDIWLAHIFSSQCNWYTHVLS